MPPRPEYWTLTKQQFGEIKSYIDILSYKLFEVLKNEGFQKIESSQDWLGFTITRKSEKYLITLVLSLIRETPMELNLHLRDGR